MTTSVSASDDLSGLIGGSKVALAVDTCSVIDILRIPQRWDEDSEAGIRELNAAFELIRDSAEMSGNSRIVLPHPVASEISDNRQEGTRELQKAIRISRAKLGIFSSIHQMSGIASSLSAPENELNAAADVLEKLVEDLIHCSISIEISSDAVNAAYTRVVRGIAPAKKGANQQMKDCAVVEHLLEVAPALRHAGCEKIIFLSSNKKDFCDESNNLKEPLLTEFSNVGIEYARRWQTAKVLALATS